MESLRGKKEEIPCSERVFNFTWLETGQKEIGQRVTISVRVGPHLYRALCLVNVGSHLAVFLLDPVRHKKRVLGTTIVAYALFKGWLVPHAAKPWLVLWLAHRNKH